MQFPADIECKPSKIFSIPERISPEEKTLASSWPDELKLKKMDDNLLDDEDDFYEDDYEEDDDLYDDEDEDDYYDDEEYYEDEYNDEDEKVQLQLLVAIVATVSVWCSGEVLLLSNVLLCCAVIARQGDQ